MRRSALHSKADRLEKKRRVYVGFIDLEKICDGVNREALLQVLRVCDVGDKLLGGIKRKGSDSNGCLLFGDMVIKCMGEEKNRSM